MRRALLALLGLALAGLAWWALRARSAPQAQAPARPAPAADAGAPAAGGPAPSTSPAPSASPTSPTPSQPSAPADPRGPRPAAAEFVDEHACHACHAAQVELWRTSDHARAMQTASDETVLGDFADARFTNDSTDTLFTREGRRFVVETEGPDGARARFDVPYVFGLDPLQQLLLPTVRGRLQALSIAWDARARRWYSLYPDEKIDARDPLHWTRPAQNWNFACAECHATALVRAYDPGTDTYATRWNRLDVGCQACHGPAGRHLDWALGRTGAAGSAHGYDAPLAVPQSSVEIEACARCHARRAPLGDGFDHRDRLLDDYLPALLTQGLYFADGQIQDEVYEYGSFLQSKMHAHNLRCSDCHEPHSTRLRASGNVLCAGCHSPTPTARPHVDLASLQRKPYDTREHHHHEPGTPGSFCVDCHMPQRTYMGIDARRDHGFRVPRPDLAAKTGAPDPCSACHEERGAAWAAERVAEWNGKRARPEPWGVALQAGRTGAVGAAHALLGLVREPATPPIVRATALTELVRYPGPPALAALAAGCADPDGLVRLAALDGFELVPPEQRVEALGPLLRDPLRAVRIEAARLLSEAPPAALGARAADEKAGLDEYEAVQRALLERPEARLNLAQVLEQRGESAAAEAELRAAVRLDPAFAPAWVNLAELARSTKGETEVEGVLRDGLGRVTGAAAAPLQHALGLTLTRQQRRDEALQALKSATELAPDDARFAYVYAVALHDTGSAEPARAELRRLLARHPEQREARFALAGYLAESGDADGARRTLEELAAINPDDPELAGR